MNAFVRRLIERLHSPGTPLSRNRHFHTFDTPEGRAALRISRRLRSLQTDVLKTEREGLRSTFVRRLETTGELQVEIRFERFNGKRIAVLTNEEFELLLALPGVKEPLREWETTAPARRTGT